MVPSMTPTTSFPQKGIQISKYTQHQLLDACCHLANMIDKLCVVVDIIMSRVMSPSAKLLWPALNIMYITTIRGLSQPWGGTEKQTYYFTPDLKLISFTNPFLHSHSYSFRTDFTDLNLYCIKGALRCLF